MDNKDDTSRLTSLVNDASDTARKQAIANAFAMPVGSRGGGGGGAGGLLVMRATVGGAGGVTVLGGAGGVTNQAQQPATPAMPTLDDMRMYAALLSVKSSWCFRFLPKDVRKEILSITGDSNEPT